MRNKNFASAKLESKRIIFFQIGIIVSLAVALMAFEWKSYEKFDISFDPPKVDLVIVEDYYEPEPVPKKPQPKPQSYTIINIIDDPNIEVQEIEIDVNIDIDDRIEEYIPLPDEPEDESENLPFIAVENMPEFPGGDAARVKFINRNINYPIMARESGIKGRVYVTFIVEVDGSITDVQVLRGIGGGCDEEAVRVVKMMPRWKPGKQFGRAVRVQFTLPVKFHLN